MNYYLVVEGASEKTIYKNWITQINNNLTIVNAITEVTDNCVYIISAKGYPQYFEIIKNAITDVKTNTCFDKLVIAIDSEDFTLAEKLQEVSDFIWSVDPNFTADIIVQHFCIEAWALGHTTAFPRTNGSVRFQKYRKDFNVLTNDPELLPPYLPEGLNRAQFAAKYLRAGLNSNSPKVTYSKSNPQVLCHSKYLNNLINRLNSTGHIASLGAVITVFS